MMRGGMAPWFVPVLVAFILVATLTFLATMFFGLTALFAFGGGWHKLAQHYPADGDAEIAACQRQTVRVGPVRYRQGAMVCVLEHGLYMRATLPFHHPMLIPWDAFVGAHETTIYWNSGVQFDVGAPRVATLSVKRQLFEQMKPYLPPSLTN